MHVHALVGSALARPVIWQYLTSRVTAVRLEVGADKGHTLFRSPFCASEPR